MRRYDRVEEARLRTLENENRRLQKLLVESMLDVSALKELLAKTDPVCGLLPAVENLMADRRLDGEYVS